MRKPLLMRVLSWVVLVPLGAALIVFCIVNRHAVKLDFWPFGIVTEVRMFAVVLGVLALGVVWGGVATWLAGGPRRRRAREMAQRTDRLGLELGQARREIERLKADASVAGAADRLALPPADAA
ncbi:MAG: hypothetical protein VW338_07670 [Rhodospirillaceae bacterium]